MAETDKDETYSKILSAAIALDFRKGHLRWSVTDLSRSAKVTRSLIYYYFGKSKEEIMVAATKIIGENVFGLTPERRALIAEKGLAKSLLATKNWVAKNPSLTGFYLVHRHQKTPIGETIREIEEKYLQKLKEFYPDKNEDTLLVLFSLFFGIVNGPEVSEEAIYDVLRKCEVIS